jgi:transposase
MVVGICYAKSVNLSPIASFAKPKNIQLEARVQCFERLLKSEKLVPLEALKPIAKKVLSSLSQQPPLMILMDRSMVKDTLNLLWISVGLMGRSLPLGWVLVPHDGNSDLALQQEILSWLKEILPERAQVRVVADREFHSVYLAEWIEKELKLEYVLRLKVGTFVEIDGEVLRISELAVRGESHQFQNVRITKDENLRYRTNLTIHWAEGEAEAWALATNIKKEESVKVYGKRYWIEEMFSDHKSRGLNLEKTRLKDADRIRSCW